MSERFFTGIYDVAIFGGGLCGIGTALTLSGEGKKVLLVERRPQLGWEITSAFNCEFGNSYSPAAEKIKTGLKSTGGYKNNLVSPPIAEIYLNELIEDEKLEVLLYSYPLQLLIKKGLACGVVTGSKSGEKVIKAKIFVDATDEAVLWKQTGINFKKTEKNTYTYAIIFNGTEKGIKRFSIPADKNKIPDIEIKPSVWKKECCVEFCLYSQENPISSARLKVPEVISFVRKNVSQLKDAIVTHTGFEPFPLNVPQHLDEKKSLRHPDIRNLFSSGIWTIQDDRTRQKKNSITGRLETGEETGVLLKKSFREYRRYIPEPRESSGALIKDSHTSDVLIAGGGTAGALAAIAAGREGAKATLLEAGTMLGGIGTGGGIHAYYHGVAGGLQDEVDERVKRMTPLFCGRYGVHGFHPEAKKFVLEQICAEAGVEVVYGTTAIGVEMTGRRIKNILAVTPAGKMRYSGRIFIDSTGDGDIAIMAGAPYKTGRETDELPHAFSQSAGCPDVEKGKMSGFNFDAGYVDPFDVVDITRGRRLGLSHFKKNRYTDESRPVYIAPLLGLRQSRQVTGDYVLKLEDEICARRFVDCIGFTKAHYDNHFACYFDFANQSDVAVLWTWILGNWSRIIGCEIPYRCLLPVNVENCLVSCRAISLDIEAHYEFRMQPDMQRLGEAAGIAAALSLKQGITPRELNTKDLQRHLRKTGALDRKMRPEPAIPEYSFKKLKEIFLSEKPQDAVWTLSFRRKAIPFLKKVLKNGTEHSRFWASVVLAIHREKDAVSELIRCVSERKPDTPEGDRTVPLWQSSIVLLGRIGDEKALPVLLEVLSDKSAGLDALIAAVRAIGRLGDKKAVPDLLEFSRREDLPSIRKMANPLSFISKPVEEDALWQIELATAESLKKLGSPQNKIIRKYLDDHRSYVRRYAAKIQNL